MAKQKTQDLFQFSRLPNSARARTNSTGNNDQSDHIDAELGEVTWRNVARRRSMTRYTKTLYDLVGFVVDDEGNSWAAQAYLKPLPSGNLELHVEIGDAYSKGRDLANRQVLGQYEDHFGDEVTYASGIQRMLDFIATMNGEPRTIRKDGELVEEAGANTLESDLNEVASRLSAKTAQEACRRIYNAIETMISMTGQIREEVASNLSERLPDLRRCTGPRVNALCALAAKAMIQDQRVRDQLGVNDQDTLVAFDVRNLRRSNGPSQPQGYKPQAQFAKVESKSESEADTEKVAATTVPPAQPAEDVPFSDLDVDPNG